MLLSPNTPCNINTTELETYLFNSSEKIYFETNEGKFEICGDKIYKIYKITIDEQYCLDNSKNRSFHFNIKQNDYKKEIYHIPIYHTYQRIYVKQYQLHKHSILTLIIENGTDFYFYTKEQEITNSIKEDMISFLSLLKLYN